MNTIPTAPLSPPLFEYSSNPLSCLSTLKRLQDHKQKFSKLIVLQTPPYLPLKEAPYMGPSQDSQDSEEFSGKLLHHSLKQPREVKIKINLKKLEPEKIVRSQRNMRILTRASSPISRSVVPSQETKIKFHIVPSFPNSNTSVTDPFSPRDIYCLLACLVTWLGILPAWDMQAVGSFLWPPWE